MKLITRDADYAFRALCILAANRDEILSVDKLVIESKVPKPFLRKILQILNKNGIIKSYKGKGGGFSFTGDPKKIVLLDIIEIFQGPIVFNDHMFKKKKCPKIKTCRIKKRIDEIERLTIEEFKSVSLASVLK